MIDKILKAVSQHTRIAVETDRPTTVYEHLSSRAQSLHDGYLVIDDCEIHIFFKGESSGPGRLITISYEG